MLPEKNPIVLLPGLGSTWHFLRYVGDHLSHRGYPIYVIPELRFTMDEVPELAEIAERFIETQNLKDVILIGHSKGGLVGKYMLGFLDQNQRIKKLIAIATPFGGSNIVKWIPLKRFREIHPQHPVLAKLNQRSEADTKIVSVYGIWDNHVWPTKSCHLGGAKNIEVDVAGHHKVVFDKKVMEVIEKEIGS